MIIIADYTAIGGKKRRKGKSEIESLFWHKVGIMEYWYIMVIVHIVHILISLVWVEMLELSARWCWELALGSEAISHDTCNLKDDDKDDKDMPKLEE